MLFLAPLLAGAGGAGAAGATTGGALATGGAAAASGGGGISKLLPMLKGMGGGSGGGGGGSKGVQSPIATSLGVAQLLNSIRLQKKANRMMPSSVDANEQQYHSQLNNLRAGRTTGAAYSEGLRQLRNQGADVTQSLFNRAGGYGGSAMAGLSRINASMGDAYGKLWSNREQGNIAYEQMFGASTQSMAQRSGDLAMMRYAQALRDSRDARAAGQTNVLNALPMKQPALPTTPVVTPNTPMGMKSFTPVNRNMNLSVGAMPTLNSYDSSLNLSTFKRNPLSLSSY